MKFLVALAFVFCFIAEGFSQKSLSDYTYVVVPEKFDFVNEKDKYQLNSLTKFLFNKHGFNAFFENELPDVRRCDGLWAEVNGRPAVIRTKVFVILNDCNGNEVYRSEVGTSKLKAYNKTYTAALREAFLSIEALEVQQKQPVLFGAEETSEITKQEIAKTKDTKTMKASEKATVTSEEINKDSDYPGDEVGYSSNGALFILKSTKAGYTLLEKTDTGRLIKGTIDGDPDETLYFRDTAGNSFPCSFDDKHNLTIETSFQKLLFTKTDQ